MKNDMVDHMAFVLPMKSQDIASCGFGSGFVVVIEEAFGLLGLCCVVHNKEILPKISDKDKKYFDKSLPQQQPRAESP
jgi:hypothetical protein